MNVNRQVLSFAANTYGVSLPPPVGAGIACPARATITVNNIAQKTRTHLTKNAMDFPRPDKRTTISAPRRPRARPEPCAGDPDPSSLVWLRLRYAIRDYRTGEQHQIDDKIYLAASQPRFGGQTKPSPMDTPATQTIQMPWSMTLAVLSWCSKDSEKPSNTSPRSIWPLSSAAVQPATPAASPARSRAL